VILTLHNANGYQYRRILQAGLPFEMDGKACSRGHEHYSRNRIQVPLDKCLGKLRCVADFQRSRLAITSNTVRYARLWLQQGKPAGLTFLVVSFGKLAHPDVDDFQAGEAL
jgi:hypothetical protein